MIFHGLGMGSQDQRQIVKPQYQYDLVVWSLAVTTPCVPDSLQMGSHKVKEKRQKMAKTTTSARFLFAFDMSLVMC